MQITFDFSKFKKGSPLGKWYRMAVIASRELAEKKVMLEIQVITKKDLADFKSELIREIIRILEEKPITTNPDWLRSSEVRSLLKISPGTLQNLRISGRLKFTKIGSLFYYNDQDIKRMLKDGFHGG